jgi:hypothetical protein
MNVIVVLAGIVEQRLVLAVGALDDLLQALVFQARAREQLVACLHIRVVVLVVMIFERFSRHIGLQRIVGIGKFGELKRHGALLHSAIC